MANKTQAPPHKKLKLLRKSIPFLDSVPDEIYFCLDPREFYLPTEIVAKLRRKLERELNHYVITYNRAVFCKEIPPMRHLCANLQGARLDKNQRKILREYEREVIPLNVSFVIYQKPLKFINPPSRLESS